VRKRALRAAEGVVVVEGAELLAAALDAGCAIEAVYVAPEGAAVPAVASVADRVAAAGGRVFDLAAGVMEKVASTVTPQPVVAVVAYRPAGLDVLDGASLVVVCVDVRDPGNLGTVIRTADAAGADAVVCCEGTVDPTNPKCVRATAGSLFHVPVVEGGAVADVLAALAARGITTVATVVRGGTDHTEIDWTTPSALVLGNEASGLPAELAGAMDRRATVAMAGRAESLNVSMAAAVVAFEAVRQRRSAGSTMPGMDGAPDAPRPRGPEPA
jgi:TrmH family RNA methyltransferase